MKVTDTLIPKLIPKRKSNPDPSTNLIGVMSQVMITKGEIRIPGPTLCNKHEKIKSWNLEILTHSNDIRGFDSVEGTKDG